MNNSTEIKKVKSDKKVIVFYIFLALIPFLSELTRLIVDSLDPVSFAESIITNIETATGTICLIPAYVFVSPLSLLFTLVPLLFIKIARAIFIKDKRYSYAAIGAIFCYNIFVKDFLEDIRSLINNVFYLSSEAYTHMLNITNIVALIFAPVIICLLFYLSQIIIRPDTGKKHVFKHVFLGITITIAPFLLTLGCSIINTVIVMILNSFNASHYVSYILQSILYSFAPPIFAIWVLFMSTVVFRDLRAGLIAIASYSIPYTIAASLSDIVLDILRNIAAFRTYQIVSTVSAIVFPFLAAVIAFLYYLLKILLPYIKMRKKALKNEISDSIADSLSEADDSEYAYIDEQTQYYNDQAQYYNDQAQYYNNDQPQYYNDQSQFYNDQTQYNNI